MRWLFATVALLVCSAAFADDPLPRAKPEEVGLSSARLARIQETLKTDIEAGRIPGAVIAIARRGKLVALDAYGWRDKAAGVGMTNHAHCWVVSQAHLQTLLRLITAVCNGNQTSVLAVSHTYPAAVVKAHPGGPAGDARREV